jgi:pimeloyl-ACP methyl ester carboxylesterase
VVRRVMASWHELTRDGVRLCVRDFGGAGPPVLLLHGLAGHAEEWAQTASWLTRGHRVVAPDARGHGRSERVPADVSRGAVVDDAAFVVEELRLGPVVVVGQSLGGLTAMSLAARRAELARGLVVVDASPPDGGDDPQDAARAIGAALRTWPVPFASREDAIAFFGRRFGGGLVADAWTRSLERRRDGWWPRFDVDVVARMLAEAGAEPGWREWERIACPTLVVRAGNGLVDAEVAARMVQRLPGALLAEITDAAHDVHLDRPDEWRMALTGFLRSLRRR